ncbi:arsenic resistance protein [Cupriavidus taiwanensis]|uniref:arsenic resistance protein n=1 Tax=Cupriavidus taiwanensis TaxID=164546 RepID=UPI000E1B1DD1|nr:arsenic resistance protein [Cupriavidus taiwanensis]SOY44431.1 Bile acid:sodium symporter [Cupriavidus taiwanensis]
MKGLRERLEEHQVVIYFATVAAAAGMAFFLPRMASLDAAINPALAFMLFVTFLQVPLADLGHAFTRFRFLGALLIVNFLAVPLLVVGLGQFLPNDPLVRLGFLLVLLTPCIDYVVTFSQIGKANYRLLLAATPVLLLVQMLLLPVYLRVLLGSQATDLIQIGPFVHAFIWLIAVPLALAVMVQMAAKRSATGQRVAGGLGLCPVPATAVVLFVVVGAVVPQLHAAIDAAIRVIPLYAAFAVVAPALGWMIGRWFRLDPSAGRAVAFSAGTRNSLVVLPLGLAVPGAIPILPAVIVTQTMVELIGELVYMRIMPRLGGKDANA